LDVSLEVGGTYTLPAELAKNHNVQHLGRFNS